MNPHIFFYTDSYAALNPPFDSVVEYVESTDETSKAVVSPLARPLNHTKERKEANIALVSSTTPLLLGEGMVVSPISPYWVNMCKT